MALEQFWWWEYFSQSFSFAAFSLSCCVIGQEGTCFMVFTASWQNWGVYEAMDWNTKYNNCNYQQNSKIKTGEKILYISLFIVEFVSLW